MFQQTLIIGNVGRDAELRQTSAGVAVCNFSVAVNRRWTDREAGEVQERTTWFRVTAWRRQAEVCAEYVRKGMRVMVEGDAAASAWVDGEGQARATLELNAREVKFLSRVGDEQARVYENPTPPESVLHDIPF